MGAGCDVVIERQNLKQDLKQDLKHLIWIDFNIDNFENQGYVKVTDYNI